MAMVMMKAVRPNVNQKDQQIQNLLTIVAVVMINSVVVTQTLIFVKYRNVMVAEIVLMAKMNMIVLQRVVIIFLFFISIFHHYHKFFLLCVTFCKGFMFFKDMKSFIF